MQATRESLTNRLSAPRKCDAVITEREFDYIIDIHHHRKVLPVASVGGHYLTAVRAPSLDAALDMIEAEPMLNVQRIWFKPLFEGWKTLVGSTS